MRPIAILTGGAHGIGRQTLLRLRALDYECLVLGRTAPAVQDPLVSFRARDLSQQDGVSGAQQDIEDFLAGRPPAALVNNAGGGDPCRAEELDLASVQSDLTLNLLAPMLLARSVLPAMKRQGTGAIVNVASTAGRTGVPYLHGYSAAKAGLIAFTQGLAAETARFGLRVNAVCPGATDTEMSRTGRVALSRLHGFEPDDYADRMADATGLSRLLRPEEVADVICWLAEGRDRPITGQAINVCGTLTMG